MEISTANEFYGYKKGIKIIEHIAGMLGLNPKFLQLRFENNLIFFW